MRKYSVLTATISALLLTLISTPAHASVPSDGTYLCTTGEPSISTPNFRITSGAVSAGTKCAGAVLIPEGVTSIGNSAFTSATSITSVTIPASVISIGNEAFYFNSALTTVTFVGISTLETIGQNTFDTSGLISINIPASVTSIGTGAFFLTKALTSITVADANPNYSSLDGALFSKNKTSLFQYPAGKPETSYSIPVSVAVIEPGAFAFASALASINIPANSTSIGNKAFFYATGLTAIAIPASVTTIGVCAFCYAAALTSVTIPASVTTIGNEAFFGTAALTSVTIPASVTTIGNDAFSGTGALTSVYFLGNAPTVGYYAFGYPSAAKAYIKISATGFGIIGDVWEYLIVAIGVYTVSYNSKGGSAVASDSFISDGAISQTPSSPTLSGYTFAGWSDTDGGDVITFPYTPTPSSDITLFAKLTANTVPETVSNPEASAPAVATETVFESIRFSTGTKVLTNSDMSKLKKSVETSGTDGAYLVTGTAGMLPGVTQSQVNRLAELRANVIKAYLVKLGVDNSNISIKIEITNQGIVPMTKISGEHLVS
jgi:uncharacterized repeat protein (TIGR02543 family)